MSRVSFKGIVVAAVFNFLVCSVAILVLIFIVSKATGSETAAELTERLPGGAITIGVLINVILAVVLTGGGYLAAKIARKAPLINGTLSVVPYVLIILFFLNSDQLISGALTAAATPLLGLLGGYLYLRRNRNFLQV